MKFFGIPTLFSLLFVVLISTCFAESAPSQEPISKEMTEEELKAAFEEAKRLFPADQPGEEDLYRAEKLLTTATGSQKPLRLAPSVASVITKE